MRYLVYYSRPVGMVLLAVLAGWLLAPRLGVAITLIFVAILAAAAALLGGHLLKTSEVGKITWKNHVAGYCIPWGWRFAGGKLAPVQIASACVWVLLVAIGVLLASNPAATSSSNGFSAPTLPGLLLALAWIVDGAAVLYLLATMVKNFELRSSQALSMIKAMSFCAAILITSVVLWLLGHPSLALLVAGGPPLVLATIAGLFLLVMLTAGRNARWN